jgi:hypothetical protein
MLATAGALSVVVAGGTAGTPLACAVMRAPGAESGVVPIDPAVAVRVGGVPAGDERQPRLPQAGAGRGNDQS